MKKLLLSIILFINVIPIFSQAEFKIAFDHIEWKKPINDKVNLEIYLKITNIGNVSGACEDLNGIWLYSSDSYYNYDMALLEYNKGILQDIRAGGSLNCFLIFNVPKAANGLTLKFDQEHGGAAKFITDSYNKYLLDEAEYLYNVKNYPEAIKMFKDCLSSDVIQKENIKLRIADCYEKTGDLLFEDYQSYKITDNLDKAIINYKQSLNYDSKSVSTKDKIANIYDILGDNQFNAVNLASALSFYQFSLDYNNSAVINGKIDNINKELTKKKKSEETKKNNQKKWEEYDELISPTTGFTFTSGIGYNTNQNSSESASFWNLQMDIPVKLYTQKKLNSPLNVFLNFEGGYSGFIGTESQLYKYLNIGNSLYTLKRNTNGPPFSEYYVNGGVGVSILSQSLKPMLIFSYGVYGQSTLFNISPVSDPINDPSNNLYGNILSQVHVGQGFNLEFSLKIGSAFIIGYAFKNYSIESNLYFLKNNYSAHYFNIGLSSF